jgi:hypothetical protein
LQSGHFVERLRVKTINVDAEPKPVLLRLAAINGSLGARKRMSEGEDFFLFILKSMPILPAMGPG